MFVISNQFSISETDFSSRRIAAPSDKLTDDAKHVQAASNTQTTRMPGNVEVNTLYSASQLLAAVAAVERTALATTAGSAKDQEAARKAAAETVRKWTDVMTGMANGTLSVGSRQPIRDTPVWVTPEVAQGGFATGQSAAGGELQPHEIALAESAGLEASRKALAAYYLTDAGLKYLTNMLETGEYTV